MLAGAAVVSALLLTVTSWAQGLEGVKRVSIRVDGQWDTTFEGLSAEDVELNAYITLGSVLPEVTVDLVDRRAPWINVKVESLPVRVDGAEIGHALYVESSLVREAAVAFTDGGDQTPEKPSEDGAMPLTVWTESSFFISAPSTVAEKVKAELAAHLDIFAAVYKVVNSR